MKLIDADAALEAIRTMQTYKLFSGDDMILIDKAQVQTELMMLPSAQPERLTDDDFETIRIHLNAYKEKLCNQQRWEEAEEYQRIIDRFMAFASAQPERKTGRWIESNPQDSKLCRLMTCSECGKAYIVNINVPYEDWTEAHKFCIECGADMRGEAK